MQEGVAMEAVEFAGHQKLDNLILIYDSNAVTLDAMAKETQSEDTAKRFEAIGFDVQTVDGHEMEAFLAAFERAKKAGSGKPQLIIAKTLIGKGIPEVEGTQKAHGEGGAKFADAARKALGLAGRAVLRLARGRGVLRGAREGARRGLRRVDQDVRGVEGEEPEARRGARGVARAYAFTLPEGHGATRDAGHRRRCSPRSRSSRPTRKIATRKAGQDVLQPLAAKVPLLIGGSADLYGSTLNYIGDLKAGNDDFKPGHRTGRNIRFGIREHGMCAILNGIAAHGIFRPSGATFLVFADYCRAADPPRGAEPPAGHLRLHARQRRRRRGRPDPRAGRDDPRPARHPEPRRHPPRRSRGDRGRLRRRARPHRRPDAARAHAPGRAAAQGHPRQDAPRGRRSRAATSRRRRPAPLDLILLSAGSELQHALKAAETLGPGHARRQHALLRALRPPARRVPREVLPRRAGAASPSRPPSPRPGRRYVGLDGVTIGIDRFGLSAPGRGSHEGARDHRRARRRSREATGQHEGLRLAT